MKRIMGIMESLFRDSELPSKKLTDDQIVVNYASNHSMLSTVFKVHSDDGGYEQYTKLLGSYAS
jgi:hypothetical protein